MWVIVKAFTLDSRYVHKEEFVKLEEVVDEHDTEFFKKKDAEKMAAKLEELERQVENLPTDRARESKIIEEFSKLAKVVESSVRYDKRKPPLP